MNKILLPTDFSENSINAIHYALELFKNTHCDFYFFNVQKASSYISGDMMTVSSTTSVYQTLIDEAQKSISQLISDMKSKYRNNKHLFHSVVDYDDFIDAVNQVSENHNIDLIIMGTKGASGLKKILFGSNTVKIMQRSNLPVLAIPSGYSFQGVEKIAFVNSNFKLINTNNFKPLEDIMTVQNSTLDILHLSDQRQEGYSQEEAQDFFNTIFKEAKHEFINTSIETMYDDVHDYIVNNNIKVLAMVDKKHSFFERLFKIQDIQRFAFNIDIPFLVMRNTAL
ncbi:universal stress protein [Oceanihabitans sp. IOP_32]|uniref:universal stress protein n=1 Tax=Oceanihabitans sp. IOP_32 TaxID=2529032 RepID=UPI0018851EC0|nr:universal stress protein [Oceanihabitans sp. IOP_32]